MWPILPGEGMDEPGDPGSLALEASSLLFLWLNGETSWPPEAKWCRNQGPAPGLENFEHYFTSV